MINWKFILILAILVCFSATALAVNVRWTGDPGITPLAPRAGDTVTIAASFRVREGGITNLRVTGGVDGSIIFDNTYAELAADSLRRVSFEWTAVAGTHTIFLQIDPGRTTADSERRDNRLEYNINVTPAPSAGIRSSSDLPPLQTAKKRPSRDDAVHDSSELGNLQTVNTPHLTVPGTGRVVVTVGSCGTPGGPLPDLTITDFQDRLVQSTPVVKRELSFKVKNLGLGCVGRFKWRLINGNFGDETVKEETVFTLKAGKKYVLEGGEEMTIKVTVIAWDFSSYKRYGGSNNPYAAVWVSVVVDPDNSIEESNEGNNRLNHPNALLMMGAM